MTTEGLVKNENIELGDRIGRTVESERFPITMDEFWFSIIPDVIVGPFDFVCVDNIYSTRTIGIVKELRTVSNIHGIEQKSNGNTQPISDYHESANAPAIGGSRNYQVHGTRIARVAVMANVQSRKEGQDDDDRNNDNTSNVIVRMPVGINSSVTFANSDEILLALGIPKMEDPVMAGVIEMTNRNKVAIPMAMSYLAGPDASTHQCIRNLRESENILSALPFTFLIPKIDQEKRSGYHCF